MHEVIKAKEGFILTNGEIYGTEIYLAESMTSENFYEITIEEYDSMFLVEEEIDI